MVGYPPGKKTPFLARQTTPGKETSPGKAGHPLARRPPIKETPQQGDPPGKAELPRPQNMLGDVGNKMAVHILLECILVKIFFEFISQLSLYYLHCN